MLPLSTWAQIDVTATAGTPGPTTYSNLRLAFAAVNDGTHQGAITIDITSSPSADNNTAVLNASGMGAANYTTVLVRPSGTPGTRTISGTINAGPLVDLNGADSVTFDGRNADGYGLTLTNQSAASTAGTSTVRFVGDATGNTLVELILLGRSTCAAGTLCGTVLFGSGGSTGNDGNTISHCTLANDGTTTTDLVAQALVSIGGAANLDLHNSGNVVEHCLIHDFFMPAGSRGIHLGAGNHAWTIANNRFFQGDERTTATANSTHHILHIGPGSHAEAGGHLIEGNVLGHATAVGTGVWALSGSSNRFRAIHLDVSNAAPRSTIRHNTMAGIQTHSTASGTGGTSPSTLVHVEHGQVDILHNLIGHADTTGNITLTTGSTGRHFHGIFNAHGTGLRVAHNTIGGITLQGTSSLYGIRNASSSAWQCDSNTIGGTVSLSLHVTGTGTSGDVVGMASDTGPATTHGNAIRNLFCGNCQVAGMRLTDAALTATRDTISDLAGRYVEGIQAIGAKVTLSEVQLLRYEGTITTASFASMHGVHVANDTLVMTGCAMARFINPSMASGSHVRGISTVNAVVDLTGNSLRRLEGNGPSTTTRGVAGIHVDHGKLTATENSIDSLANPGGQAVGIQCMDAPFTLEDNVIATVEARSAWGVLAERGPGIITGNTIGPLQGVITTNSNQTVIGMAITDSSVVAHGNLITTLENGATGSSATVRGIHLQQTIATLTENTISEIQGHATGTTVPGVLGIYMEQGLLNADRNSITGLDNSSNWCMGMLVVDGQLEAEGNTISTLSARSVFGIHTLRSPARLHENNITGLLGTMITNTNREVYGIYAQDSLLVATDNGLQHLTNGATGSGASVRGIISIEAPIHATGNTIAHIHGNGSGTSVAGIVGIAIEHSIAHAQAHIAHNRIHTLRSDHGNSSSRIVGIQAALRDTSNVVEGNFIHSLWRSTTSSTGQPITGIHLISGSSTLRNNMVALGTDSTGAPVPIHLAWHGIHVSDGEHAILHNTVFLGGEASTGSSQHTYALLSETTGTRDHRNNILWNARSNGSGSAKHYAVGVNASLTGLVSDHNCLYVSGTGGHVGREGTTDRTTLGAWQSATSLDGNSISTDPGLVRPDGDATEVDLHIQHNSAGAAAISRAGATGTGVLYDFDGAQRHSPPDIGADQILLVLADFYEEPDKPSFNYWRNKGQVADTELNPRPDVKFYTDRGLPRTYLHSGSLISFTHASVDTSLATPDTTWRVDLRFTGGKERAVDPQPVDMRDPYRNYYLPWCGPNGATQVHGFGRVVYEDLYPYTDLHFYSGSGGPKLAFVIRPGGDMDNIQLEFEGQDSLTVDGNGVLHAHVAGWDFPLVGGIAYQVDGGGNIIPVGLTTYLNDVGSPVVDFGMSLFSTPVDPELPLVLLVGWPPTIAGGGGSDNIGWSTFFGGQISEGHASDVDAAGNLYVGGSSMFGPFPTTTGTTENPSPGSWSCIAAKFNNQHQLQWATYYGGTEADEIRSMVFDEANARIYIVGYTYSSNLPTPSPGISGAYHDNTHNGNADAFMARLNPTNGQLTYGTFIGGLGNDWAVSILVDGSGEKWLLGYATNGMTLQTWGSAHHQDFQGGMNDGFVVRMNASEQLIWSTFVGGSGRDEIMSGYLDGDGNLFFAGFTSSTNFPMASSCGTIYQSSFAGGLDDAIIGKITSTGDLCWVTYMGGSANDVIPIDDGILVFNDRLYVIANTNSIDFPTVPYGNAFFEGSHQGNGDAVVMCFSLSTMALLWSTYLGGSEWDSAQGLGVDDWGNLFVTGHSHSSDFPLEELTNAYNQTFAGSGPNAYSGDAFLTVFSGTDLSCPWSTMIGGSSSLNWSGGDAAFSIEIVGHESLYLVGFSNCDLPSPLYPVFDPGGGAYVLDDNQDGTMVITKFNLQNIVLSIPNVLGRQPDGLIDIFPNPSGDLIYINLSSAVDGEIEIIDMTARAVLRESIKANTSTHSISVFQLDAGQYIVRYIGPFTFTSAKFIKQ